MRLIVVVAALIAFAGCKAPQDVRLDVPPPQLRLLEARPLQLPIACVVESSVAVEFQVLPDGRTGEIRPLAAPECARNALVQWVAAFRYVPPPQRTASRVEWLVVTARRGS